MFWKASKQPAIRCTGCGGKLCDLDFLAGRDLYLADGPYCLHCTPLPPRTPFRPPELPRPAIRQRL
jgi:hypothetical protein